MVCNDTESHGRNSCVSSLILAQLSQALLTSLYGAQRQLRNTSALEKHQPGFFNETTFPYDYVSGQQLGGRQQTEHQYSPGAPAPAADIKQAVLCCPPARGIRLRSLRRLNTQTIFPDGRSLINGRKRRSDAASEGERLTGRCDRSDSSPFVPAVRASPTTTRNTTQSHRCRPGRPRRNQKTIKT
ncbi:hypothetical protein DPEC_G00108410 [Dallia pectoralis]|uniref:Uncharacterized protein n=1 Tax=Dallia pectoralis TaxID=75939 RepID=A0ACC2GT03_DALPE|nr:hypothetical protein DPEC_G00108410 [Dallia pectoralis]